MRPVFDSELVKFQKNPVKLDPFISLIVFHILFGYFAYKNVSGLEVLAFMHMGICSYIALFGKKGHLLCAIFYSVGSEVFWRMTDLSIRYEFNKYLLVSIFIVGCVRWRNFEKQAIAPVLYLLFLVPSVFVRENMTRQDLSFNLSGPICLVFGMLFFSSVKYRRDQIIESLKWLIVPIVGVSIICILTTINSTHLVFTQSVMATSGGFGPNQVSSILGLGGLVSFVVFSSVEKSWVKTMCIFLLFVFLTQVVLTFSRGGFYTAICAIIIYIFSQQKLGSNKKLAKYIPIFIALIFGSISLIQKITNNAYRDRFSDFNTTGRIQIAKLELKTFLEYPIFGIGPGGGKEYRSNFEMGLASHTEYTRLLAEHGIFGLGCLIILIILALRTMLLNVPLGIKYFALSFQSWAILYMFHAGMRLAAPAVLLSIGLFGIPNTSEKRKNSKVIWNHPDTN